jgi:hypothetical protein
MASSAPSSRSIGSFGIGVTDLMHGWKVSASQRESASTQIPFVNVRDIAYDSCQPPGAAIRQFAISRASTGGRSHLN